MSQLMLLEWDANSAENSSMYQYLLVTPSNSCNKVISIISQSANSYFDQSLTHEHPHKIKKNVHLQFP